MLNHQVERPYWMYGPAIRIGWIKQKKGKGWSASLRLGMKSYLTEDMYPDETFTLPQLRVRLAEQFGVVVPMQDKLLLVSTRAGEKMYTV